MDEAVEKHIAGEAGSLDASTVENNPFLFVKDNQYGKGVYARVPLRKGTLLRLYKPGNVVFNKPIAEVPEAFRKYVAYVDQEHCNAPADFATMDIAWFINHAASPNVVPVGDEVYRVERDIAADEELYFNYNHLNEPPSQKDDFYA